MGTAALSTVAPGSRCYGRAVDVTLTQLRYFAEAAAQLSMTRAADRLMVAQSAVSTAVAQLERATGSQFFIRQRSKGLVLTSAGERFLKDVTSVLAHLEESLDHARGEQSAVTGRLRLVCFSTLAPFLVPGVLARLAEEHPGLELSVFEADAAGCVEALTSGRADLALCYDYGLPSDIAVTAVHSARPYVALPVEHRLAGLAEVDLSDLRDEPFILLDLPHTRELMLGILEGAGLEPHVRFRSGSFETVRTFVANGHGFSILHQRPRHDLTYDGNRLAAVRIQGAVPELRTVVARLRSQPATIRMKVVAEAVKRQVTGADLTAPEST